jgi:amino acid transporter
MVGLPSSTCCLVGVDSCIHMAEEVKNASKVVPRPFQYSVLLNGALGLAMLVAYLFCLGDLDDVIEGSATLGYAYIYVFLKGTGSAGGAAAMALIMWFMGACCLVGMMAVTSHQTWSFARDRAVPFSDQVTNVDNTIMITAAISMLLSFIALGSYVAFSNIVNLSIGGLYASLLYRRHLTTLATYPGYQPIQCALCGGRPRDADMVRNFYVRTACETYTDLVHQSLGDHGKFRVRLELQITCSPAFI